jgi:hypothetical protein
VANPEVRYFSLLLNKPTNKSDSCDVKVQGQQQEIGCCCQKFDEIVCMERVFTDVEASGRDENIQGSSCIFSDEINLTMLCLPYTSLTIYFLLALILFFV